MLGRIGFHALFLCSFLQSAGAVENRASLGKNVDLSWTFDGTGQDDLITFEITARTNGWVGLGFSPNGAMTGSDIVVGGVLDGVPYLHDMYALSNSMPIKDDHSDYELLSGEEANGVTKIRFRRKLVTCDENDYKITNSTLRLIWAKHESDMTGYPFLKHEFQNRGSRSVRLLEPPSPDSSNVLNDPDVKIFDMVVENVTIPSDYHTLYWCNVVRMPSIGKHHLIRFEPVITPGNEPYLHHLIVYHCKDDMTKFLGKAGKCFAGDGKTERTEMYACQSRYIAVWAIGGQPLEYPPNMGVPVLDPEDTPFYLMEVHYDNSAYHKNLKLDSSGLRFYITQKLRPVEIGTMTIGMPVSESLIVPPGQERTQLTGFCPPGCTKDLPQEGIYAMNALLHEHLLGVGVRLRQFRNGVELPVIFRDDHYDFNYQDISRLSSPRLILPNDTLVAECDFKSTSRRNATLGGFGTKEEMCFVFMDYYPKTKKLHTCMSAPNHLTYAKSFGLKAEMKGKTPVMYDVNGNPIELREQAMKYDWTPDRSKRFLDEANKGDQFVICSAIDEMDMDERKIDGAVVSIKEKHNFIPVIKIPKPSVPYIEPDVCQRDARPVFTLAPTARPLVVPGPRRTTVRVNTVTDRTTPYPRRGGGAVVGGGTASGSVIEDPRNVRFYSPGDSRSQSYMTVDSPVANDLCMTLKYDSVNSNEYYMQDCLPIKRKFRFNGESGEGMVLWKKLPYHSIDAKFCRRSKPQDCSNFVNVKGFDYKKMQDNYAGGHSRNIPGFSTFLSIIVVLLCAQYVN